MAANRWPSKIRRDLRLSRSALATVVLRCSRWYSAACTYGALTGGRARGCTDALMRCSPGVADAQHLREDGMQAAISLSVVKQLRPAAKPFEVRDTRVKGFLLR